MKKFTVLFYLLMMTVFAFGAKTDFMVNLATAKHKAGVEGKLYMVHFTATWCTPCKWMNSYTFTDERVAEYLSDNYVPVKINVDDFDGILIKQKNNVQFLPTLLIFNSKGEEVGRFEEAIGPSKLMIILEENNIPVNREKIDLPEPQAAISPEAISRPILPSIFDDSELQETPKELDASIPVAITEAKEKVIYTPPAIKEEKVIVAEAVTETPIVVAPEPAAAKPDTPNINTISPAVSKAAEELAFLSGEGIFELDVKYKQKEGFSVQIGLYARYENVLAEVNKFKKMYGKQIYVHIGKKNGVPVYRLLMGNFSDKPSADRLEFELKAKGLDCFVNDLSRL